MPSSGGRPLADRLKAFADRFAALGRPSRPAGYTGVGGRDDLSAPLVGPDSSAGDYAAGGEGGRYAPPRVGGGGAMGAPPQTGADAGAAAAVHLPTPVSVVVRVRECVCVGRRSQGRARGGRATTLCCFGIWADRRARVGPPLPPLWVCAWARPLCCASHNVHASAEARATEAKSGKGTGALQLDGGGTPARSTHPDHSHLPLSPHSPPSLVGRHGRTHRPLQGGR